MEITAEAVGQQLELQKMYRDDKFAEKLRELQAQYKQTQNAQRALDERKKDLMAREKICDVIQGSQKTFNEQKAVAEAHNLSKQQANQRKKDQLVKDRENLDRLTVDSMLKKEEAEKALKTAQSKLKQAEGKLRKAEDIEKTAIEHEAAWAKRLGELGLKAA